MARKGMPGTGGWLQVEVQGDRIGGDQRFQAGQHRLQVGLHHAENSIEGSPEAIDGIRQVLSVVAWS